MTFSFARSHGLFGAGAAALALLLSPSAAQAQQPPSGITLAPPVDVTPMIGTPNDMAVANAVMATNGTDALTCWTHTKVTSFQPTSLLSCARFTAAGVTLDPDSIQLDASLPATKPVVGWDGAKYVVLVGVHGQRLDPTTGALDSPFTLAAANGSAIANGGGFTLALSGLTTTVYDASFNAVGQVTLPGMLPGSGSLGAIATYASGTFFVAWITPSYQVQAARISTAAKLLDATPIAVDVAGGDAGTGTYISGLAVGASDSAFLVAWNDFRGLSTNAMYGTPVTLAGNVVTPRGALLVADGTASAIAGAGSTFWMTTTDTKGDAVAATPVSALGIPGTPVVVPVSVSAQSPAVAATGATTFFAWTVPTPRSDSSQPISPTALAGERIDSSGSVEDATPVWISEQLRAAGDLAMVATASGYFVTWSEITSSSTSETFGVRLARDGTPLDSQPLDLGPTNFLFVSATNDEYVVARTSPQDQSVYFIRIAASGAPQVLLAATSSFVEGAGVLCSSDRCILTTSLGAEMISAAGALLVPSLARPIGGSPLASDGTSFLVLGSLEDDAGYGVPATAIVAPDGTSGSGVALSNLLGGVGVVPAAWGFDRYMIIVGQDVYRLGADGSSLEPGQIFASLNGSTSLQWDGRAFLFSAVPITGTGSDPVFAIAAEFPSSGPVSLANQFSLFAAPIPDVNGVALASAASAPGDVLFAALQPRGNAGTLRVVSQRVTVDGPTGPNAPDAGPDAGEGGAGADGGAGGNGDAGADDGGSASGDAGVAEGGDDAGPTTLSTPDAGPDATTGATADGGTSGNGGASEGAGCGCRMAGSGAPVGEGGAGAALAGLMLVVGRRRRARRN